MTITEKIHSCQTSILASMAFFIPFTVYLLTLFPSLTTEDAGELITAAWSLGIAHPPGYPLYTFLGKLFTVFIPFGDIAWRVNVMSAFFGASVSLVFFLFLKKYTNSSTIALAGALIFPFTDIAWSQSIRAEVYSLNNFFLILVIFLAYQWHKNPKSNSWWYALCFTYGLSLTNHHMMFVLAPPLALFALWTDKTLWKDWRRILKGTGMFFLGLSFYLYLPIRSAADPILDWGNPETWQNFYDHITRQQYGGVIQIAEPTAEAASSIIDPSTAPPTRMTEIAETAKNYFHYSFMVLTETIKQFLLIIFPLAILGMFYPKNKQWKFHVFLLFTLFLYFATNLNVITIIDIYGDFNYSARPFLLPIILILCIFLGIGLSKLQKTITALLPEKYLSGKYPAMGALLAFIIPLVILAHNYSDQDQHLNYINYDLNKYILSSIEDSSVVYIAYDESYLFGFLYLQSIEKLKPDIKIFTSIETALSPQWPGLAAIRKDYPGRPVYSITNLPEDNTYYDILPRAVFYQLVSPEEYSPDLMKKYASFYGGQLDTVHFRGSENKNIDHRSRLLLMRSYNNVGNYIYFIDKKKAEYYLEKATSLMPERANNFTIMANQYLKFNSTQKALELLEKAIELKPNQFETLFLLGWAHQQLGNDELSYTYLARAEKLNHKGFYTALGKQHQQSKRCNEAFISFSEAFPDNSSYVHLETANCYIGRKEYQKAIHHLEEILRILPADSEFIPEVKNKIQNLQQQKPKQANIKFEKRPK